MPRSFRFAPLILIALAWAASTGSARAEEGALAVTLSTQAATRAEAVSSPEISAPVGVSGFFNQPVTIQADATDPNAGDVLTITQSGAPASLTFSHTPSVSPAVATLSGTLTLADVGTHIINWEVSDGITSAFATTSLGVAANSDPTISAPATFLGAETIDFTFAVTASDPDGDPIGSLTAAPLPAGATFIPNAFLQAGEFAWTPAIGQAGDYNVTFTVESGSPTRSASTSTAIHIGPQDHFPVIAAPATVNAVPNVLVTVNVTVSDVDGHAINSLICRGTQNTALPAGAVFTKNGTNTAGTLTWTPTSQQVGNVGIDFIATSGPLDLRTVFVTRINVRQDRVPVVTAPATVPATEGVPLTVNVTASDPDATPIASLTTGPLPMGATFTAGPGNTTGTLNWAPDFTQAGTYSVVFTASNALTGTATTSIVVANQNRAPIANAGGPYFGSNGSNVSFDGSGSSDPDGDALIYAWDFGDGNTGAGATPSHAYPVAGEYNVTLRVTDPGTLFGDAATTATIRTLIPVAIILKNNGTVLDTRKATKKTKLAIEQTDLPYSDILVNTLRLTTDYPNSGSVTECAAEIKAGTGTIGDMDVNGPPDFLISFGGSCVKNLFSNTPNNSAVNIFIDGQFQTAAGTVPLHGVKSVTVRTGGGGAAPIFASASPNPFNPETAIAYTVKSEGRVTLKIYSIDGRLVRTLKRAETTAAGTHEVTWNGTDDHGRNVSSGVYFVKTSQRTGSTEEFSVLKLALTK